MSICTHKESKFIADKEITIFSDLEKIIIDNSADNTVLYLKKLLNLLYYYVKGDIGMTSNGSFTKDRSRWITFTIAQVNFYGDNKPWRATHKGKFICIDKY
jgi:hypothetical protein